MNQVQLIVWCLLNGLTYGGWVSFLTDCMVAYQTNQTLPAIYTNERFYLSTYISCIQFIIIQKPYCRMFETHTNPKGVYHWKLSPLVLLVTSVLIQFHQMLCTEYLLGLFGIGTNQFSTRLILSIQSACIATCVFEHIGIHHSFRSWSTMID
jgi:hypothetical protein